MDAFSKLREDIEAVLKKAPATRVKDLDHEVALLFTSPRGKEVLNIFREAFVRKPLMVANDPYATAYNVGLADFVHFIEDAIDRGQPHNVGG